MKGTRIALKYIILNFQKELAYRANAIATFFSVTAYFIAFIFSLQFAFGEREFVGGYSFDELFFFLVLSQLWWFVNVIFVRKSLQFVAKAINSGSLDYFLLKPVRFRSIMPFIQFDVRHIIPLIFTYMILCFQIFQQNISIIQFVGIQFFIVVGIIISYAVTSIAITFTFWVGRNDAIFNFKIELPDLIRIPSNFFDGIFSLIFTVFVPVILIANPIYQITYGEIVPELLYFTVVYTIILLIISEIFWKIGLRNYTSAN